MMVLIYSALVLGIVLVIWRGSRASNSMRASEESAHLAALLRRKKAPSDDPETRRETRFRFQRSAAASVLGGSGGKTACRIINTSRSGMRIVAAQAFPVGAQVQVQWDEQFFIGAVCYSFSKDGGYISGLELVACSYSNAPAAWLKVVSWAQGTLRACLTRLSKKRVNPTPELQGTAPHDSGDPAETGKSGWTERLAS